jgi:mannose-6-phosphate isomerase-like protein (cupin superfamily)
MKSGVSLETKYVVNPEEMEPLQLVGREMRRLITSETVGAENLTVLIIWVQPGEEVLPCHSHEAEEAAYIVQGEGEYWIDGRTGTFQRGEVVWFPYNCKHMIRNTGKEILAVLCVYSPPMHPNRYTLYEDIEFD